MCSLMKPESIADKYTAIEALYGREGLAFAKKLIGAFAKSQGDDAAIWSELSNLYRIGEIVPYEEGIPSKQLQGKILLKHGIEKDSEDYEPNAAFGYIDSQGNAQFADVSTDLYQWDGRVSSITTALLDLAQTFHRSVISSEQHLVHVNDPIVLITRGLFIANRMSHYIKKGAM